MSVKITILGCGGSAGVPAIGNYWGACDPNELKNRRTRSSIAVQSATTTLIVDTGPDFKEQINRENIQNVDAVLYTHHHADHVNGVEDLRGFVFRAQTQMPLYMNKLTHEELKVRFAYLFDGGGELYPPVVNGRVFENYLKPHTIDDIEFTPFIMDHGTCESIGYLFENTAYCVDMVDLDDQAIETIKGVKNWVVDAAGYHMEQNKVHANLKKIYALNEQIGAQNVYLTSLTLGMDHQTLLSELPDGYKPAYDGLIIR